MDTRRILVARTDRLGEFLLTVPAIEALARAYPAASVSALVSPTLAPLAQRLPVIDAVIQAPRGPRSTWLLRAVQLAVTLRRQNIELAVVFNASKETHLAVWLAGIPVRVGYDRKWGFLLNRCIKDERPSGNRHEIESNWLLACSAGVQEEQPQVTWLRFAEEWPIVAQKLKDAGWRMGEQLISIHPWSSNAVKAWPQERFLRLAALIAERANARVVFIGGQEHAADAERLNQSGSAFIQLVGRLALPELGALLKESSVVVSNDSGPMHLAAMVGTPVVALFGTQSAGSHPKRWGPWGEGHTVIRKPLSEISPEEVFQSMQRYVHCR